MSRKPAITDDGKQAFLTLAGSDGEIDAYELRDILNRTFNQDSFFNEFSIDMARSLVAVRDLDLSGKLGFDDFKKLWSDLALCKKAFMVVDSDNSGFFNRSEFQRAIDALGLTVSSDTLKALMMRYSSKEGTVKFDDFVACYMKLKLMQKTFRSKDIGGVAEFLLDEYVQLCIYS
jgi:Ca2+-binding EF-hand superfamily protein